MQFATAFCFRDSGDTPWNIAIACWLVGLMFSTQRIWAAWSHMIYSTCKGIGEPMATCVPVGDLGGELLPTRTGQNHSGEVRILEFKIVVIAAVLRLGLSVRALYFIGRVFLEQWHHLFTPFAAGKRSGLCGCLCMNEIFPACLIWQSIIALHHNVVTE